MSVCNAASAAVLQNNKTPPSTMTSAAAAAASSSSSATTTPKPPRIKRIYVHNDDDDTLDEASAGQWLPQAPPIGLKPADWKLYKRQRQLTEARHTVEATANTVVNKIREYLVRTVDDETEFEFDDGVRMRVFVRKARMHSTAFTGLCEAIEHWLTARERIDYEDFAKICKNCATLISAESRALKAVLENKRRREVATEIFYARFFFGTAFFHTPPPPRSPRAPHVHHACVCMHNVCATCCARLARAAICACFPVEKNRNVPVLYATTFCTLRLRRCAQRALCLACTHCLQCTQCARSTR